MSLEKNNATMLGDTWQYRLASNSWLLLNASMNAGSAITGRRAGIGATWVSPSPRWDHMGMIIASSMLIYRGELNIYHSFVLLFISFYIPNYIYLLYSYSLISSFKFFIPSKIN